MTVKLNTFEGGSEGLDVTNGTWTGSGDNFFAVTTSNGSVKFAAAAAQHGTMGATCTATTTAGTGYVVHTLPAGSNTAYAQMYTTIPAAPSAATTVLAIRNTASGAILTVQLTAAGKVSLLNSTNGAISGVDTTYTYTWGTKIRVTADVVVATTTTGTAIVNIYPGDSATAAFTFSSTVQNMGTTAAQFVRAGIIGAPGVAGWVMNIDDVYLNDTGVDPGVLASPPTLSVTTFETNHMVHAVALQGTNPVTGISVSPTTGVTSYGTTTDQTFNLPHVALGGSGVLYTFTATDGTLTANQYVTVAPDAAAGIINIAAPKANPPGLAVPNNTWE